MQPTFYFGSEFKIGSFLFKVEAKTELKKVPCWDQKKFKIRIIKRRVWVQIHHGFVPDPTRLHPQFPPLFYGLKRACLYSRCSMEKKKMKIVELVSSLQ